MVTFLNSPRHLSIYDGVDISESHSHRERDDSYSKIIIQLAPRWRIIECRNALQWIIQHRSSKLLNRGHWLGVSYHHIKKQAHRSQYGLKSALRCIDEGCVGWFARDYFKT